MRKKDLNKALNTEPTTGKQFIDLLIDLSKKEQENRVKIKPQKHKLLFLRLNRRPHEHFG